MSELSDRDVLRDVRSLLKQKRYDEAIAALKELLDTNPDSKSVVQSLGTACFLAGRLEQAAEYFQHLTRLAPTDVNGYVNLGAVYNRLKEHAKATEVLRRGLQRDRNSAEAYYNLAIAHRGSGNASMAVSAYREVLRIDPDMVDAHHNLGNVLSDMGNHQQAIVHYREALARNPNFEKARRGLECAERAASESRQAFNPFGRLVERRAPGESGKHRVSAERSLSPEDRADDRERIRDAIGRIKPSVDVVLGLVGEQLEPAITSLVRTIAKGRDGSHLLQEQHEQFHQAVSALRNARATLSRDIEELVGHEAEMFGRSP